MKKQSHLNNLKKKHAEIEQNIKTSNDNHTDEIELTALKKQKLKLKERIVQFETSL